MKLVFFIKLKCKSCARVKIVVKKRLNSKKCLNLLCYKNQNVFQKLKNVLKNCEKELEKWWKLFFEKIGKNPKTNPEKIRKNNWKLSISTSEEERRR